MKLVAIFAATRREVNAVRRVFLVEEETRVAGCRWVIGRRGACRLFLVQTGVGNAKAGSACRQAFLRQQFDLAIACGFGCALTSAQIGDLLIGTEVMRHPGLGQSANVGEVVPCAAALTGAAINSAREAGVAVRSGRLVTVPAVVWRASDKREMAAETGAIGLDMESAMIGAAAREWQVPFLAVRAVSDLLDEDLPLDFNLFLEPGGWAVRAVACLMRPSRLVGLTRLRAQAATASDRMTAFFRSFLDAPV